MVRAGWGVVAASLLALSGCPSPEPPPPPAPAAVAGAVPAIDIAAPGGHPLPGDDEVLVRVAGRPLTRYDLERAAERLTGAGAGGLDPALRGKLLEGLVAGRVLAVAAERELEPEALAAVERQVATYRDELLAKRYLARHAVPEPVSDAMVAEYYRDHPERFGGGTTERYELLTSETVPADARRAELLRLLGEVAADGDWEALAAGWREQGLPLRFRRGEGDAELLQEELRRLLAGLAEGEASRPMMVAGRLYRLRLLERHSRPPRPLPEVSAEIRRQLLPLRLKEAVRQATGEALAGVAVERLGMPQADGVANRR